MARIIAVANQKGGTGKTTTTLNIGVALAERGKTVALIDLDPQGSLTHALGVDPEGLQRTIYNVLISPEIPLRDALVRARQNLLLVPANIDLAGAEFELPVNPNWQQVLKRKLTLQDRDLILIDCPTSLGVLTVNALVAAQEVLIPAECSFLVFRGLRGLLRTIDAIRKAFNPELNAVGILPVKLVRTRHAREALEGMRHTYGSLVSEIIIPQRVKVADALVGGQAVVEFAPKSDIAEAYRQIAEVLDHGQEDIRN
jgi:chromosome partitioning protein